MRKDETVRGICEALLNDGLIEGFAYDHFRQQEAVATPFAVYRRVAPTNFSADGTVYHHGDNVDFELYADTPDEMALLMGRVEELMDEAELFYNLAADTAYIEQEDFYETLYEL